MSSCEHGVVGILAGGGSLPREVAERVTARGGKVHIVAIEGEADAGLSSFPITWVGWGRIGAMLGALRSAGCARLVIVGSVRRPDLSAVRPDLGLFRCLPAILRIIAAGGDDSVLSRVVRFFEAQGFEVVSPATVAPDLLIGEGPLGHVEASPAEAADAALGFEVVRALGPYDVGQAVVVTGGRLEAIEGVAGTDAMLARVAAQRRQRGGQGDKPRGVLVKRPKPGQELRIDLPAIGPGTIGGAIDAGLAGVAVLARGALAAERTELVRRADASHLFAQGFRDRDAVDSGRACGPEHWQFAALGRRRATKRQCADAAKGAGLLAVLEPLGRSRCAIVDNGHVLAVESSEGVGALIANAGALRQWGRRRWSRRSGVAVLNSASDLQPELVRTAAQAGLAGLGLVGQPAGAAAQAAIAEADRLGLAVVSLAALGGQHGRQ
ncbi:MAG TPA: UDP-2,3-diacylglucosamine diphosphatase LpxI [Hyphomicrobium sp.]|nr:UDP-2,3-diacylglucosamine diphosphatase LpxI [Hyphomicrobium sp.]